ncbi:hypothetical protein D3I93_02225 [Serratia marcescens]|uniref:hypothetical protein n=1 Tax=Serratia marcescens TaxID=615 RepID=UPI000E7545B0|nr:hypothetical protein [Serratia marcescens]RJY02614.1 hypothetical protein D3I93_02225 [Serratia marcescens]
MTLTTEQLRAVETTKEFRALLKYMRAIAKAEPKSVKEKFELEEGLWRYASQKTIKAIVGHIDALEFALAANREAQPVSRAEITKIAAELVRGDYLSKLWTEAEKSRHVDTHRLQNLLDELHDVMKVKAIAITRLLTAPPAPAVPAEMSLARAIEIAWKDSDIYSPGSAYRDGWNACRAAMLAQPVSSGYTLPPHVYRELVNSLRDTAVKYQGTQQIREQLSRTLMQNGLSAAAPEGGNG